MAAGEMSREQSGRWGDRLVMAAQAVRHPATAAFDKIGFNASKLSKTGARKFRRA
jgi:hypothetical protein